MCFSSEATSKHGACGGEKDQIGISANATRMLLIIVLMSSEYFFYSGGQIPARRGHKLEQRRPLLDIGVIIKNLHN